MATGKANLKTFEIVGEGSCVGGAHPNPPLDHWPLLVWAPEHPTHGARVFTEDGRASVQAIAVAACETPSYDVLAAKFGTTADHIAQAIDYATAAGFLA